MDIFLVILSAFTFVSVFLLLWAVWLGLFKDDNSYHPYD